MKGLIDTTLREGMQTVGVSFTLAQRVEIVRLLSKVGIEEIELGVCTMLDPDLPEMFRLARDVSGGARLALWCRCRPDDISHAGRIRPDVISLSIPASDLLIRKKLGKDRSWVLSTLSAAVRQAQRAKIGLISVGFEDATRADPSFLEHLTLVALNSGAARIRLADTVGIANPVEISALVKHFRKRWPVEIAVHAHNDFGLATANALAALASGADWADVTVLGLGERAGNARLEEVSGYLALREQQGRYRTRHLLPLCETVALAADISIAPHHPVVGHSIFSCETGLHLHGLMNDPETYEPYDPQLVGAVRKLLLGSKAGCRAVKYYLNSADVEAPDHCIEEIVMMVRERARNLGRPLEQDELTDLVEHRISALLEDLEQHPR